MKIMKVCQIVNAFPPGWGGSETHNYTLVKYLLRRGYDVDVIAYRTQNMSRESILEASATINKGINVHNLFPKPHLFWMPQLQNIIKEIEKDRKIDVFDFHSMFLLPFNFPRAEIILSLHFFELTCPLIYEEWPRPCAPFSLRKCQNCCGTIRYFFWKLTREYAKRKIRRVMVKFDYMKKSLEKSAFPKEKIVVIPHWIDVEAIRQKSKRNFRHLIVGLEKGDRVFTYFARLSPENGPFLLLNAFNLVAQKRSDVKLVYIGGGELRAELERFCAEHDLQDKVIFLGMIPYTKVHEYLSISDVIVSSHSYMNYNWALLEGMCTEKPIVATNVAATIDILRDGYNALLAEPTPESLSSRMMDVLDNPELGKRIAENAFRTVKTKHSLKNLEKYEELIHIL